MHWTERIADLLLVVFVICIAIAAVAQVRHNVAAHHPRDRPVAHHSSRT
jgi:hypothetical protein